MTNAQQLQRPSFAWVIAAGLWFWLVSWLVVWITFQVFSSNTASWSKEVVTFLPYSLAPLVVGMLAWWAGFHQRRPLLASGASIGFVVGLTMWPMFLFFYFVFAFLVPAVFILAGFIFELVYLVFRWWKRA